MLEYPWQPHTFNRATPNTSLSTRYKTREEAFESAKIYYKDYINGLMYTRGPRELDDLIHLTIQNTLEHTTNAITRSLARSRIPSSAGTDDTERYLIALTHEKHVGYTEIVSLINISYDTNKNMYYANHIPNEFNYLSDAVYKWARVANRIVELMKTAGAIVGNTLVQDADFIRDAALIELGYKTGLELTTGANAVSFGTGELDETNNRVTHTLAANNSFFVEKFDQVRFSGTKANNTDTLTITSKNGPNQITVTTNNVATKSVLAKDASKVLVDAELMASLVTTQPIEIPTATRELPDITDLEVGEVQSVNIDGLFTGIRVNKTAVSSDANRVSLSINEGQTSMGVTAVARSTSTKVTVTGTNEAGAVSVSFNVRVIEPSE